MSAAKPKKKDKHWNRTGIQNLYRHKSGIYYLRARVNGKPVWKSLDTSLFSIAKVRKDKELAKIRRPTVANAIRSDGTVKDARTIYEANLENSTGVKNSTRTYRLECIAALFRTWPDLEEMPVKKITEERCREWAKALSEQYSATRFNNTVDTFRLILDIGIKQGWASENPASAIEKARIRPKKLVLPSKTDFPKLVQEVETAGGRFSKQCADLIRFLAFSGCRQMEASYVTFEDLNFEKGLITISGHEEDGTKNREFRVIPMIPEMRLLLERLTKEPYEITNPERQGKNFVMPVVECQKALDRACKLLKIHRITHHDLRHLFATRCIESAVDIPTIARWLGHKDGGVLAMRTYGHLRDEHSVTQAQKVSFGV